MDLRPVTDWNGSYLQCSQYNQRMGKEDSLLLLLTGKLFLNVAGAGVFKPFEHLNI